MAAFMADVSAGVWMPQSKKQRRCRTARPESSSTMMLKYKKLLWQPFP